MQLIRNTCANRRATRRVQRIPDTGIKYAHWTNDDYTAPFDGKTTETWSRALK